MASLKCKVPEESSGRAGYSKTVPSAFVLCPLPRWLSSAFIFSMYTLSGGRMALVSPVLHLPGESPVGRDSLS
jgi:hypothetical protein